MLFSSSPQGIFTEPSFKAILVHIAPKLPQIQWEKLTLNAIQIYLLTLLWNTNLE